MSLDRVVVNQKKNIQVNFENAKVICPFNNYSELIIRDTIENITKDNIACNDVLSCNISKI